MNNKCICGRVMFQLYVCIFLVTLSALYAYLWVFCWHVFSVFSFFFFLYCLLADRWEKKSENFRNVKDELIFFIKYIFSVYPIEEMRSERKRDRDAAEVEESWKGLNSGGDASKSDKKFWDILKTRVVGRRRESGIREGCDTFRSRWCNGHSAEQVTETTGKRRGKDIVVDMSLR